MRPFSRDAGIPVLTEIIAPPLHPMAPSEAALVSAAEPAPAAGAHSDRAKKAPDSVLGAEEFDCLADIVLERVLTQLQSRFETLLGAGLEAQLSARLQAMAADLAREIRADLQQELETIITATRAQDHGHLDFIKK